MNVTVGSAPDSWGVWFPEDSKQIPASRFLDEIVEAGYEWTELGPYGYLPTDLETLKRELAKRNLRVSGTFAMGDLHDPKAWPDLDNQVTGACESLSSLGAKFLILIDGIYTDEITHELRTSATIDDDAWKTLVEKSHSVARFTQEKFGIRTVFHPHAETHVEYEDQIERFLTDTDPELIGLCFDTGHHAYRGGEPIAFYRKHHARIEYLHIKSIDADIQKDVTAKGTSFGEAVGQEMFCEPSRGAVDFIAFRDALRDHAFEGFAIVEQDMYPCPFDKPLPIAKRTRVYLQEIGLG